MGVTRPVLRWHGGKWVLAPWIMSHFPEHRIYVEPFGGAASVLLRKPRSYSEVYNDLDDDVVNLFRVLRSGKASDLVEQLRLTPFASAEFFSAYHETGDPVERARRMIVRSFQGFGSNACHRKTGFRSNSNRSGTTPAHDWMNYPNALEGIIERLRGVTVINKSAVEVMSAHDGPDTLHYVDPPYAPDTRDKGDDYAHELSADDHIELVEFLRSLRGKVILSGYPNDDYDRALSGWVRVERAALADGARKRTEVLWMNFDREPDLFGSTRSDHA
ncbi:DNA adenine methylase [Tritonibacter mobilis]|nr:DNA adenine methylase [Tritonibacter mobilis]